jgi:DNA polymerase-1
MSELKEIVIDCETNALRGYDKVWNVVCTDLRTGAATVFRNLHETADALRDHLRDVTKLIGHNIIGFDNGVLAWLGIRIPDRVIFDTLIVSRLLNYNLEGGHSLRAWGVRLKDTKSDYSDFSCWSQALEDRCVQDTLLTRALYNTFGKYLKEPSWQPSITLEHQVAFLCEELHENGFGFNYTDAVSLKEELEVKVRHHQDTFAKLFPPRSKLVREITPQLTKSGTLHAKDFKWLDVPDLTPFEAGSPFSLFESVPFNPNSPAQVVQRLNEAGWRPINKTKGHIQAERDQDVEKLKKYRTTGWKVDEDNLSTLPDDAPEDIQKLTEYLLLSARLSSLTEWLGLYNEKTKSIHGVYNGIGSWTHRKSHNSPNMANVPALINRKGKPQPYGPEFRALFQARKGRVLVGCDAEGIQLRAFAHYCNDQKLINAIAHGNKDDGTDIHTLNKGILGTICNSRNSAKTYIYALLLGAGKEKQAAILQTTPREALAGLGRILDFYPGWKELKETKIRDDGRRGFFTGLDGRKVMTPGTHYVLAGYLQNFESVVMKRASVWWHRQLRDLSVPFWFVNDVHDEWQTETLPEYATLVGQTQADSIRIVGEEFGLNCPLAGSYVVGNNWKETH